MKNLILAAALAAALIAAWSLSQGGAPIDRAFDARANVPNAEAAVDSAGTDNDALVNPTMGLPPAGSRKVTIEVEEGVDASLEVSLAGRRRVRGTVQRPDGSPASGATLWAGGRRHHSPLLPLGLADVHGRFDVHCAEQDFLIQASLAGYAPSLSHEVSRLEDDAGGARLVDLRLRSTGFPISGRVVDAGGLPVAGATVSIGTFSADGLERHQRKTRAMTAVTDGHGAFELPAGFPPGAHALVALAPGFAPTIAEAIVKGEPIETTLILGQGATIEGTVLSADGSAAVGATITIDQHKEFDRRDFPFAAPEAKADERGHYVLRQVPLTWMRVAASAADDQPKAQAAKVVENPLEGGTYTVNLELDEGYSVAGNVVDASGLPIEGLRILVDGQGFSGGYTNIVMTDAAGHFRLTGLDVPGRMAQSRRTTLSVKAVTLDASGLWTHGQTDGVKLGATDVQIVAERPVTPDAFLTGRVLNDGEPIPNDVEVTVAKEGVTTSSFLELERATGRYRAGPLVAGRYLVKVSTEGHPRTKTPWIDIGAGETIEAPDLRLLGLGSVRLSFRWEDGSERGSPASIDKELIGYLEYQNGETNGISLVQDGDTMIASKVPPGTYSLRFLNRKSFAVLSDEVVVTPGELSERTIPLAGARRIVVAAALPFDQPWEEVTLTYEHLGGWAPKLTESMNRDQVDKPPYAVFRIVVPPGAGRFTMRAGDGIERKADHTIPIEPTGKDEVFLLDE